MKHEESLKAWHVVLIAIGFIPFVYGMKSGFARSREWMYTSILATAL